MAKPGGLTSAAGLFSSRRRHTGSKRDWSSDVCSSDLARGLARHRRLDHGPARELPLELQRLAARSEERRVGKECKAPVGREDRKENRPIMQDSEGTDVYVKPEHVAYVIQHLQQSPTLL